MRKYTRFCLLEVLTPVHIGSGEYYEPMDYFPKEKALHLFDHSSFQSYLKQIGKSDIFFDHCRKSRYDDLLRFIDEHAPKCDGVNARIPLSDATQKVFGQKRPTFGSNDEILQVVKAGAHSEPIIPGSSVKGALRTLVLNSILGQNEFPQNETNLLAGKNLRDSNKQDAFDFFRDFRVSDFSPIDAQSQIDIPNRLSDKRKLDGEFAGVDWRLTTQSRLAMTEFITSGQFIGEISFGHNTLYKAPWSNFEKLWEDLLSSSNAYLEAEDDRFMQAIQNHSSIRLNKGGQKPASSVQQIQQLLEHDPPAGSDELLLKIGRHTGGRTKMLEHYFGILPTEKAKYAKKRKISDYFQSSIWLSSTGIPLGWVKVRLLSDDEWQDYQRQCAERASQQQQAFLRRQKIRDEQQQQQEAAQQAAVKRQQQREAEAAAKAAEAEKLASMGEVERTLHEVSQISTLDNREGKLLVLWQKLDSYSPQEQQAIAEACKQQFVATGKWSGKISKKQKEKVSKIKQILGE
ncbi:type III-A CRISPR-associated RAMP protein Csm5 [Desulfurispira natronophila]|uniref:CRISPR system Cms protein Csm5 n=1 Tax=Desulfurispira natronophila TaxID=682562 RepID=A0A7W8DHF7_9BACT|nr:type III-A CRISPR-associated RAMP protein Csm5 [Desulfurispira natronophila]MBB5022248.1 CRISPR-associated protein Csm5 [Desulfurispira natronophila]